MPWHAMWQRDQPFRPQASEPQPKGHQDEIRLFPIVGGDLCLPVAVLLSRDRLEEAGRLVPDRAWVASTPLYG
jgi:hypothetical protein